MKDEIFESKDTSSIIHGKKNGELNTYYVEYSFSSKYDADRISRESSTCCKMVGYTQV